MNLAYFDSCEVSLQPPFLSSPLCRFQALSKIKRVLQCVLQRFGNAAFSIRNTAFRNRQSRATNLVVSEYLYVYIYIVHGGGGGIATKLHPFWVSCCRGYRSCSIASCG